MRNILDSKLFSQPFEAPSDGAVKLENGQHIAQMYTRIENSISVLSDLMTRKSYFYYGALAEKLGVVFKKTEISSIWEDELLSRVHPDDLLKKYRLELQFFQLINALPVAERTDYGAIIKLRIRDKDQKYIPVKHRLLYLESSAQGSIWLALCLYNTLFDELELPGGIIINTRSGKVIDYNEGRFHTLLSAREKEILQLIRHGQRSKEIASKLALSIHTVNRHRQNIFQKLNVTSAMEACRIADKAGLL